MIRNLVFSPVNLALIGALVAVTIAAYVLVPAGTVVPVHWGPEGQADAFAERNWAFAMMPAIVAAFLAIFAAVVARGSTRQIEAGRHGLKAALAGMLTLFLALQAVMLMIGLGWTIDVVRIIAFGLAVLLVVFGNIMPKSQPNGYSGMRLPWTLADARNWQATNRFTGTLYIAAGILLAIASIALSGLALFAALLAAVLLPALIGTVYSYNLSRQP